MRTFSCVSIILFFFSMPSKSQISFSTSSWMKDLRAKIGDTPLNNLVIPGTHDSASDKIELNNPNVVIAQGAELHQIANLALGQVVNFAKTQNVSVYEQLKLGARSLDLRVAFRHQKKLPGGIFVDGTKDLLGKEQPEGIQGPRGLETIYYKNFWTHHEAYSEKFDDVLAQIKKFLDENKEEIVILRLDNHYNFNDNIFALMAKHIRDGLGGSNPIATPDIQPNKTSLNDLLKRGFRAIVILQSLGDEANAKKENFWFGGTVLCPGTWANKQKFEDLFAFIKESAQRRLEHMSSNALDSCKDKLWDTGLTLTPDKAMITESFNVFNPHRIKGIKQLDDTIKKNEILDYLMKNKINPNIVSMDFMNADIAKRIIELNLL